MGTRRVPEIPKSRGGMRSVHPRRAVKPSRRAVAKAAVCRSRGPEWGVRGLKNGGVDLSPLKGRSPKGYPRRSASPPFDLCFQLLYPFLLLQNRLQQRLHQRRLFRFGDLRQFGVRLAHRVEFISIHPDSNRILPEENEKLLSSGGILWWFHIL